MNKIEARALLGNQSKWALRNMAQALQTLTRMNHREDWRRLEALRALGYKVTCRIPGGSREIAAEIAASRKQGKLRAMGEECAREYVARHGRPRLSKSAREALRLERLSPIVRIGHHGDSDV